MYSIKRTSPILRYGVAVLVAGVAVGIKLLLDPVILQDVPFLLLFGAVMLSAWYGGLGPGLLTMVLSGLATNYLFLRPQDPLALGAIPLLVFFVEGTLICLLTGALRTARRRAEASKAEVERDHEHLRRNEEHFRSLVEGMREHAIFTLDPRGHVASWDAERLTGYAANEIVGEPLSIFFTSTDIEQGKPQRLLQEASEQGRSREEAPFVRLDGSRFRADTTTTALHDKRGKLRGFSVVMRDITEQRETEEALKRSLDVRLALYETGRILGSSLEWEEIGSRLLEVVRHVSNLTAAVISVPDESGELRIWRSSGLEGLWRRARFAPEALSARRKVLQTRERCLLKLRRPDNPDEYLVSLYLPLLVQDRLIGVLEIYSPDAFVDEGAETLYSLLASQAASALENARLYTELSERENQLRDLVGKLIMAQEEERRRVAYDIHDGLAQSAAAAHQHLQAFARHHTICSAQDQEELDEALELVRELVGEARQVIYDLRPTVLDDFGLAAAVRLQVATLRADGLEIDLNESLGDGRLPQEVETTLFRVAQEALTNIRKHARATKARMVLDRPGNAVRLLVSDEGRGFVPKGKTSTNGRGDKVGLSGMRERVSLLGGRFDLHSEPGRGTTIEAEVELPETGEEQDHEG
jgi:PAS domain S-box-containing protein